MKFIIIFLVSLLIKINVKSEGGEEKNSRNVWERSRYGITFGNIAPIEKYPYFVRIWLYRDNRTYFCGGAIIGCNTIVTAAHCVYNAKKWLICYGSNQTDDTSHCTLIDNLNDVCIHNGFLHAMNNSEFYDDVAIITTSNNFCAMKDVIVGVGSVCQALPNETCDTNYLNKLGKAIGCGKTETGYRLHFLMLTFRLQMLRTLIYSLLQLQCLKVYRKQARKLFRSVLESPHSSLYHQSTKFALHYHLQVI